MSILGRVNYNNIKKNDNAPNAVGFTFIRFQRKSKEPFVMKTVIENANFIFLSALVIINIVALVSYESRLQALKSRILIAANPRDMSKLMSIWSNRRADTVEILEGGAPIMYSA